MERDGLDSPGPACQLLCSGSWCQAAPRVAYAEGQASVSFACLAGRPDDARQMHPWAGRRGALHKAGMTVKVQGSPFPMLRTEMQIRHYQRSCSASDNVRPIWYFVWISSASTGG